MGLEPLVVQPQPEGWTISTGETQRPLVGSHASPAPTQITGASPVQMPSRQVSHSVHALPSSQGARSGNRRGRHTPLRGLHELPATH